MVQAHEQPQHALVHRREVKVAEEPKFRIGRQIRAREVLVIDETGKNIGLLPLERALGLAEERGLSLLEVGASPVAPVTRLVDYGKYRYELSRQEKRAKAHQKEIEVKEIRLSYKMAEHDRMVRISRAGEFLAKGNKIKIEMRLRGREQMFSAEAVQDVLEFRRDLSMPTIIEQEPKKFGNRIIAVLAPDAKAHAKQQAAESGKQNLQVNSKESV